MNTRHKYRIDTSFGDFVNNEVLPLTSMQPEAFWDNFLTIIDTFMPRNRQLCLKRQELQAQIDEWHIAHQGKMFNADDYQQFLRDIGYLVESVEDFTINTRNVDNEIATLAGPQLVVPLKNARFALNAANARWGSLYDALYGTDAIEKSAGLTLSQHYNVARGSRVVQYAKDFLDESFPLQEGSHRDATAYLIYFENLLVAFPDGRMTGLRDQHQFVARNGSKSDPTSIVLQNNGLHIEIMFDRKSTIGSRDLAGIEDIQIESALTTIMDCEDSVAAVDSEDKIDIYRHWLGLMQGNLSCRLMKEGKIIDRCLQHDKHFSAKDGSTYELPGRSLLLIRNVGLHMDSHIIQTENGSPVPEGIIDAVITSLIASIDLAKQHPLNNSRSGSIYIVKPKLHGPEEVAFTNHLFDRVENMLDLKRHTIKMGIMDEERRTTVNLKACIREAKNRVAFINTGFLDRTGDEIHTSMKAGAFLPKADIKQEPWLNAYENNNVAIGLACGFHGRAQIGKGMWAMPDEMNRMMSEKISHPESGANTAWVPSPTAATLHALHYHKVNVADIQQKKLAAANNEKTPYLRDILTIPLLDHSSLLNEKIIQQELDNNIQSILGYVVHWINSGTGCSKIADIHHIGLMEDRATLRISCQHIANWLHHKVCSSQQVSRTMQKMAEFVDEQNKGLAHYYPMTPDLPSSHAFNAATMLIFSGVQQENGYTEEILHRYRQKEKAQQQLHQQAQQQDIQEHTHQPLSAQAI